MTVTAMTVTAVATKAVVLNSTGSSSDDDDDDTYAEVNRKARAKGFEPKDCGGGGGCFFKSIATSEWGDKTQHKKLRRMVVEELRRNEGNRYSPNGFPAPGEADLKEISKTDTHIEGQMEMLGTCNVLGINIGVIGRTAQHDKLGTKCFKPTKGRASRTAVVLHYVRYRRSALQAWKAESEAERPQHYR